MRVKIVKYLFFALIILFSSFSFAEYKLVNVNFVNDAEFNRFLDMDFDLSNAIIKENTAITLILNDDEFNFIKDKFNFEIIQDNYEQFLSSKYSEINKNYEQFQSGKYFKSGSYAGNFTVEEIYANFDSITKKYPNLVSKFEIGKSIEKRSIYAYCFGPSSCMGSMSYPQVLINGVHHAREPISATINIYTAWKLIELLENNDAEILYLLQNRNIVFVPIINPDGYEINYKNSPNGGGLWRKNSRVINGKVTGVDINRNYGPQDFWDYDKKNAERQTSFETYPGNAPFSEPETQAMKNLASTSNFKTIFNYHTYGNMLVYPYNHKNLECPDSNFYRDFSFYISKNTPFTFGTAANILNYVAQGGADDFHFQNSGALSFTIEIGDDFDGFYTRVDSIIPYCEQNFQFIKQLIWSAGSNVVIKDVDYLYENGIKELFVEIQNIGFDLSDETMLEISSANPLILIDQNKIQIPSLAKGESYNFRTKLIDSQYIENGSTLQIYTNLLENNIPKKDSFQIQYHQPVYKKIEFDQTLSNFKFDENWWAYFDTTIEEHIISSNVDEKYLDSSYSIIELPAQLFDSDHISFEFDIKYAIEMKFDFLELQIYNFETAIWENLRSSRMNRGIGLPNSTQLLNRYGFQGYMPMWINQVVALDKYKNDSIKLRYVLMSDKGSTFWGAKLKNFKFRIYSDVQNVEAEYDSNFANTSYIKKGDVFTAFAGDFLNSYKIDLYNYLGMKIFTLDNNIVETNNLQVGIYYLIINNNNQIFRQRLMIVE